MTPEELRMYCIDRAIKVQSGFYKIDDKTVNIESEKADIEDVLVTAEKIFNFITKK
jgi:hypothetical protein